MNSEFQSFLDAMDAAHADVSIRQAVQTFALAIGFECFAYLQVEGTVIKTFNTYASAWESVYLDNNLFTMDPVVIEARRRMEVFPWSADNWSTRGSIDLRRFRDTAISHGLRSGMTIPVPGSFGSTIMLTFASSRPNSSESACLNPEEAVQAALAIHYQLRSISIGRVVAPASVLSSKEAVCVTWSAKGKKAHEIADIMGISDRTVQHYMDSARRKMGALTIQHLTALVTRYGVGELCPGGSTGTSGT